MTATEQEITFESQLAQLEKIVDTMEQGDLPLEEALKQFEAGIKLTRSCQATLDNARQKVKLLTDEQQLEDFPTTSEE